MVIIFKKAKSRNKIAIKKQQPPEIPEFKTGEPIADKKPSEPEWKPIHDAADRHTPKMVDRIIEATEETKENVNRSAMKRGIRNGNIGQIEVTIPFDGYNESLQDTESIALTVFEEAGEKMIIHLPPEYRDIKFTTNTERAQNYINNFGANLVREVGQKTRDAIRIEIDKALKEGLGADRTAKNVINLIGLTERQAGAVTKFRQRLLETGIKPDRAEREAEEYASRLLRYRAENIARTELMGAANQGHLEMIEQGIDEGIIPADVQRVWIVTPDDRLCKYCRPMEGQTVGIDEYFVSELGNVKRPPLHPQCRCVTGVEFD